MDVQLRIRRYNPEADAEPHWEEYEVEAEPTDRVLDLLHQVKWYQDGTLTFRRSCAHGVCGSDAMLINGRNRLACEYLVKDAGTKITVEAIRGMAIVKDLLVDMEPFWESYKAVKPYLVNDEIPADGKERRQSQADRERYEDTSRCILCAACTASCPVFWADQS
ncbi:MAG: 2Fe-2S iron-sulfur cluster-binding protein, partial [Candidatus Limnocylindria bacterium]